MQGVRRNRLDPSRRVFGLTSSGERTIVRLWRDAASAGRDDAAYLAEVEPGRWREVSWGEAARADTFRLRARARWRDHRARLPEQLGQRSCLSASACRGGGRAGGGRDPA